MKVAASLLVVAVLCLAICSVVWLRLDVVRRPLPENASATKALNELADRERGGATVDLANRYADRRELLEPRFALPQWHTFPYEQAASVHRAIQTCPPADVAIKLDPALAKVTRWHAATCGTELPSLDEFAQRAPFMHPSGRSYAALALAARSAEPAQRRTWIRAHARSFHVLELASLGPDAQGSLDDDGRTLAGLPASVWEPLAAGDDLFVTPRFLVVAEPTPAGVGHVRLFARRGWEEIAQRHELRLIPRNRGEMCARPASSELCWELLPRETKARAALTGLIGASALVSILAVLALVALRVRERRQLHADRIHVLHTMTHELRTPATNLRLDIEPLRDAYDELPAQCQAPLLRISDGIERLQRVLHLTARFMALFETPGAARATLAKRREISSTRELFAELSEEWPEGVTLKDTAVDGAVLTDPEWLSVAVRNLVENTVRHGRAPVTVAWKLLPSHLVVRVSDTGVTPALSLRDVEKPFSRDRKSEGLGLGLSIVVRIAKLLGGNLTHEPSPTAFELTLPSARDKGAA